MFWYIVAGVLWGVYSMRKQALKYDNYVAPMMGLNFFFWPISMIIAHIKFNKNEK